MSNCTISTIKSFVDSFGYNWREHANSSIKGGDNETYLECDEDTGRNGLMLAIIDSTEQIAREFMKQDVNVNECDKYGLNALMILSICRNFECSFYSMLLDETDDVNHSDINGNTALHLLLGKRNQLDEETYDYCEISLGVAAIDKHLIELTMGLLRNAGMRVDLRNNLGLNALDIARANGFEIIEELWNTDVYQAGAEKREKERLEKELITARRKIADTVENPDMDFVSYLVMQENIKMLRMLFGGIQPSEENLREMALELENFKEHISDILHSSDDE